MATAQRLGREMLSEMGDRRDEAWRHVLFINAVADYRLGHYSAAKEKLRTLVLSPQGHRQAQRLLDEVEDRLVEEALFGRDGAWWERRREGAPRDPTQWEGPH